jgi:hypothetical protein
VTAPGWHPDPWQQAPLRWWDGTQWTPHTSGPPPAASPSGPASLVADEQRSARWARIAFWTMGAGYVVTPLVSAFLIGDFVDWIDQLGDTPFGERSPDPPASANLSYLLSAPSLAGLLLVAIWQYRASLVGRALGRPQPRDPGLSAVGWMLPVVNFWFPYTALRDSLPPAHPARSLVLRWWMGYWAVATASFAAAIAVWAGPAPTDLIVLFTIGGLALWNADTAVAMVDAIEADHRSALTS